MIFLHGSVFFDPGTNILILGRRERARRGTVGAFHVARMFSGHKILDPGLAGPVVLRVGY